MVETPNKTALIPAVSTSNINDKSKCYIIVCIMSTKNDEVSTSCTKTTPSVAPSLPLQKNNATRALDKNQLREAVNYLLKNGPDFVNKLHEYLLTCLI